MMLTPLPKWCEVLCTLNTLAEEELPGNYVEQLVRRVDTSNSHLRQLVNLLERRGFLERVPSGPRKLLQLTEKGRNAALALRQTLLLMGRDQGGEPREKTY